MAAFIKLTQSAGDVVYVNPELVVRFRSSGNQTLLVFSKDDSVTVKEKLEEVARLLQPSSSADLPPMQHPCAAGELKIA